MRAPSVPRWLKGSAWASPHRSYVRIGIEGNAGVRAEVYLTRAQAIELRERLIYLTPTRERRPSRDLPDSDAAGCLPVTQEEGK